MQFQFNWGKANLMIQMYTYMYTLQTCIPLLDPPLEPRLPPLPLTVGSGSRVGADPTNRVVERGEEEKEGGGADFCWLAGFCWLAACFKTALLIVSFKPPPP